MTDASEVSTRLVEFGVATIYEAAGRKGYIDIPLRSISPGTSIAGPVRIASCGQGDNRAVHEVMAYLQPGEVLLLTMPRPEPTALVGELLATQAKAKKAAGMLVDAAVRDIKQLKELALPIWARYFGVSGANKAIRGEIDVPVSVGGVVVFPGDYLVLDDDGAVAIPKSRIGEVIELSQHRNDREAGLLGKYREGYISYDLYGMREQDEGDEGGTNN